MMIEPAIHQSISSLAARYGVSLRTLRFYEQQGILSPIRRGTERRYGATDEIKLQLVLHGKRLGMSLREIKDLILTSETRKEAAEGRLTSPTLMLPVDVAKLKLEELEARHDTVVLAIEELKLQLARRDPGFIACKAVA